MRKNLKRLAALAAVLALMAPSTALAASSTEAYSGDNSVVAGLGSGGGGGGSDNAGGGGDQSGLPFTGADLGALVGAGVLLLGAGVGLRVMTQRPQRR